MFSRFSRRALTTVQYAYVCVCKWVGERDNWDKVLPHFLSCTSPGGKRVTVTPCPPAFCWYTPLLQQLLLIPMSCYLYEALVKTPSSLNQAHVFPKFLSESIPDCAVTFDPSRENANTTQLPYSLVFFKLLMAFHNAISTFQSRWGNTWCCIQGSCLFSENDGKNDLRIFQLAAICLHLRLQDTGWTRVFCLCSASSVWNHFTHYQNRLTCTLVAVGCCNRPTMPRHIVSTETVESLLHYTSRLMGWGHRGQEICLKKH